MVDDTTEPRQHMDIEAESDTYRTEYQDYAEPPSEAVVRAVAAISGDEPFELTPLYEVVDPDALDALFLPTHDGPTEREGEVAFNYCGYRVEIRSYGVIEIHPTSVHR